MTPHRHARADPWSARDLSVLFSRCSAGDARARETIILRFLPLARRLARTYDGRGEPIEDLCQAACVGLITAVDRYSPERAVPFPAYARPMILGAIRRHFRDTTWRVHVPRPVRERAGRVLRAEKELRTVSGSAKPEAIANYLDIRPEEVLEARCALAAFSPGSLDATHGVPDGNALPLREVIGGDELAYERAEVAIGIRRVLLTLKPRDQKILLLRLGWELSQDDIARRVGLSQMHVSRILRKAGVALSASCGLAVSP
ncbi:MAG TPA: sigma-70 family RNA polymerase sigma factor [Solirubrobacteraceae bacterium]|nr:sigma-70 family RNA polymerase sigma factor [Solirubrobacteraceae bacterium]